MLVFTEEDINPIARVPDTPKTYIDGAGKLSWSEIKDNATGQELYVGLLGQLSAFVGNSMDKGYSLEELRHLAKKHKWFDVLVEAYLLFIQNGDYCGYLKDIAYK